MKSLKDDVFDLVADCVNSHGSPEKTTEKILVLVQQSNTQLLQRVREKLPEEMIAYTAEDRDRHPRKYYRQKGFNLAVEEATEVIDKELATLAGSEE